MKTFALDPQLARSILEVAPAIVLVLEPAGCIEYVNPAFESLTGLGLDEVRGQEWCSTCLPHRDRARTRAWYRAALDGLMVPDHTTPIVSASGLERQIEWQARPVVTGRDRLQGVVCLGRDVTEAHRQPALRDGDRSPAERAYQASESRLRRAQRVGRIGSWEYDIRTDALDWSDEMYRIMELDVAKVGPARGLFSALVHPEDRDLVEQASQMALEARLSDCLVHRLLMHDGRIKWVENRWEFEQDEHGATVRIVGTLQDVTDRRHAEQELRRSRDLLRVVIDSSPDFIFAKDAQNRYLFANRAFAERRGTTVGAMLGRQDWEFWPVEFREDDGTRAKLRATDQLAMAGETTRQTLEMGSREEGTWRAYDAIKRPLQDPQGRPYGVLVYSRDTTEHHLLHEAQARALAENETLLREIHHRVKNNLQIISSLLHFQAKKVTAPADKAAFEDGRKRLLAMMLVHERLYQAKELTAIEFGLYIRSLVHGLVNSFETDGRVQAVCTAASIRVPAEVALPMGLVVCELVTNALKYAYPEDRVGTVEVDVDAPDGGVRVIVRDSGVGLPVDFDPANPRSFGWHLVTTMVHQLGAALDVRRDAGTCVRIELPHGARPDVPVEAR